MLKTTWAGAMAGALVAAAAGAETGPTVKTTAGAVRGTTEGSIRVFKGVPFAAPPVGNLRWKEPQPVARWTGVKDATQFGAQCMQVAVFGDIKFPGPASEDCLTLNVWTPAQKANAKLPVMVWIHGGGFQAGAGSEPRHDGTAFAKKGIVLVSINYRLGIFGFFAHPELTAESARHASGNYGLMDQAAALRWVKDNIAAFGGNPANVTIFGESAGSFAVCGQMMSPMAAGLFQKAIGESGAFFSAGRGTLALPAREASEQQGEKFAAANGGSLAALRAKSADELLLAASRTQPWFSPNLDGAFFVEDAYKTFGAGKQARVPLLAGWNADEIRQSVTLRPTKPTVQSFADDNRKRFGDSADAILQAYPAATDAEAIESAAALASDLFIGHSTWKWIEMHSKTGGAPVYRYSFDRKIPPDPDAKGTAQDIGARHAGEIEYVFGALASRKGVAYEDVDRKLSDAMTTYWANFARTGNPNGGGLPSWPRYNAGGKVQHLDVTIESRADQTRARYEALDAYVEKQRGQ